MFLCFAKQGYQLANSSKMYQQFANDFIKMHHNDVFWHLTALKIPDENLEIQITAVEAPIVEVKCMVRIVCFDTKHDTANCD